MLYCGKMLFFLYFEQFTKKIIHKNFLGSAHKTHLIPGEVKNFRSCTEMGGLGMRQLLKTIVTKVKCVHRPSSDVQRHTYISSLHMVNY